MASVLKAIHEVMVTSSKVTHRKISEKTDVNEQANAGSDAHDANRIQ